MAIASGLACVDYLATNYRPQNFKTEELRYSPTFNVDDILSTIIARQQQHNSKDNLAYNSNRYSFSSNVPPVLEFTNLSLVENDLEFTLQHSDDKNTDIEVNNDVIKKSDFSVVCDQMKDVLCGSQHNCSFEPCVQENIFSDQFNSNNAVKKCKQNSTFSCQKNIFQSYSPDVSDTNYDSDEDEEIGSIFSADKPSSEEDQLANLHSSKSNALPCFHKSRPRLHAEDIDDCDELSDSEFELSKIILNGFSTEPQELAKSNTRKRSLADINYADARFKRPCIDAEKMHQSIRRKEVFVPISKF